MKPSGTSAKRNSPRSLPSAELNRIPEEIINHTVEQGNMIYGQGGRGAGGNLMWSALLRKLDREAPGYAS